MSESSKTEEDAVRAINDLSRQDRATLKTYLPVVIDEVDVETDTCRISRREDDKQLAKNVPLATPFKSDGAGVYYPLDPPEEGYAIIPSVPEEELNQRTGHTDVKQHRHHDLKDAHVIARRHYEDDNIPDHDIGDYLLHHPSGSFVTVYEDSGDLDLEHHAGHHVRIHDDEVVAAFERPDGDTMSVTITEEEVVFDGPDLFKRFRADPRTRITVREDGTSNLGGRSVLGDADANRVDPTSEDTRAESPHTHQQVNEPAAPIADPTTETTKNPATATLAGALDGQGYEARGLIPWERREEDPDPAVTDPTSKAYIDIPDELRQQGELPAYIPWVNTSEEVAKWWKDGAPEVLFP